MEHKEDIQLYSGAYFGELNDVKVGNEIDLWIDVDDKISVDVREVVILIRRFNKNMVYVKGIAK